MRQWPLFQKLFPRSATAKRGSRLAMMRSGLQAKRESDQTGRSRFVSKAQFAPVRKRCNTRKRCSTHCVGEEMVELPLAHYRFYFRAEEGVKLPAFSGSAWRGAFGNALKRTLCATRLSHCTSCPLLNSCSFPYLFEGRRPLDAEVLTTFERISVPFALRPPRSEEHTSDLQSRVHLVCR